MPGPVERWLETFMCKQYADTFEAYGYQTLQSVCQLQLPQLLSMGVAREHCENILENVNVLRQTMMGSVQQYPEDMSHSYDSNPHMPQSGMGMPYSAGDNSSRSGMPVNMSVYGTRGGNYGNQGHMMMAQQQSHLQNQNMSNQHQQYNPMFRHSFSGPGPGYQGSRSEMGTRQEIEYSNMGPRFQTPGFSQRHPFPVTQVQGSMGTSQSAVQQAHPHLRRNSGQTPQEVANNILQIASSTYPSHHTVQVPLSKNRPAPYQVPPKSPHFNVHQAQVSESQYQGLSCQPSDYPNNKQFVHPHSSPHMLQHNRMSPISPSPGIIQSPHSHHSGQSLPSSSPHGSVHSPVPGGIQSPGSDRSSVRSPIMNTHVITPQGNSYQPMTPQNQQMRSPVPVNQQLQVSVSPNISAHRSHGIYGENVTSPKHSQFQQHSTHFSPGSNVVSSPGRFSNISSPYTPGSKTSHHSPNHPQNDSSAASQYLTDIGPPIDTGSQDEFSSRSNPLRSLQKLCMLPERQVVDPKSVVNDACIPSPQDSVYPKNSESNAGWQDLPFGNEGTASEPTISVTPHCTDGSNCSPKPSISKDGKDDSEESANNEDSHGAQQTNAASMKDVQEISENLSDKASSDLQKSDKDSVVEKESCSSVLKHANEMVGNNEPDEIKCQPKKAMLLRAAQDDANKQKQELAKTNEVSESQGTETKDGLVSEPCESFKAEKCSANQSDALSISDRKMNEDGVENSSTKSFRVAVDPVLCTNSSISEDESDSNLNCNKDIVQTYGKKVDRMSSVSKDLPTRIRGQSTGSYSDELENSDFDYEDHIGCDDIDNNQTSDDSFLEKENIMNLDNNIDDGINSTINEIKSAIITDKGCKVKLPSSPHWKKSKLNDLQALQQDKNQTKGGKVCDEKLLSSLDKGNKNSYCRKTTRLSSTSRKLRKTVNCRMDMNGHDSDSDEFCQGEIVDMGIGNGDGTFIVSKRSTTRKRKQPLKYEDTSFIQGDFIFADEEEEEDFDVEPKKKHKKTLNYMSNDENNDVKKSVCNNSKTRNDKLPLRKNGLSKSHQVAKCETKVSQKDLNDSLKVVLTKPVSQLGRKNGLNVSGVSEDEQLHNTDSDDVSAHIHSETGNNEGCDNDFLKKSCDNSDKSVSGQKSEEAEKDSISEINANNLAKTEQTGSASKQSQKQTKSFKGAHSVSKQKATSKNEHYQDNHSATQTKKDREKSVGDSVDGLISATEEKNRSIKKQIITVISDSDKCSKTNVVVKKKDKSKDFDEVTLDLTSSDDELVNHTGSVKVEQEDVKFSSKTSNLKCKSAVKPEKPKAKSKAKLKCVAKKKSNKKKKGRQKISIYDNDSDYEAGPKHDSLKSLKLNKTQDLLSMKKKPEKHGFKGPSIHIEGSKECPKKCTVVNQPFQEADLKTNKTKSVVQNVSSVEISHLPSDRSVVIPNSETEETETWICALCGKHSSYMFLGDLFGPYTVEIPMEGEKAFSPKHSVISRGGRSRSVDSASTSGLSNRSSRPGQRPGKEATLWKEVWVHECCCVWADGVFLIGSKIYGLQEAVKIASKTVCSRCHEHGAMVGCLHKGCQMKFHYACATEEDCILNEENFSLLCPKHKSKKLRQPDPSFSSWG